MRMAFRTKETESGSKPKKKVANCRGRIRGFAIGLRQPRQHTRSERSRGLSWCLSCLFRAEIGAIYAKGLKELQKTRP